MHESLKIQKKWVNKEAEFIHYELYSGHIEVVSAQVLTPIIDLNQRKSRSFDPVPAMLREALGRPEWEFSIYRHANQAPYVQLILDNSIHPISISHTEQFTLIALSKWKYPIGIDIEAQSRKVPEGLHKRILSPGEHSSEIQALPVIQLWTLKEAALKWAGTGLRTAMNSLTVHKKSSEMFSVHFSDGTFVSARSFVLDNYWVSIATTE